MIHAAGQFVRNGLADEIVKSGGMFSILADEAADVSNKENLSLVLRFVDSAAAIREVFFGFFLCEATTGLAITCIIMKAVQELGLSMALCRGQGYDGTGNMAGKNIGAATLIQNEFPLAVYVHCMNHALNLCVGDTCKATLVRNMMGSVRKLSQFFDNSPKSQGHLIYNVTTILPESTHSTLIDACRTRWLERLDGFDRIIQLMVPLVRTLNDITSNLGKEGEPASWNDASRRDASTLSNAITFEFLVTLVVVSEAYSGPFSECNHHTPED